MTSLCISPSSHPTPISSAATPKIQFAQHLDGGLYLIKFSLDIEVNLLRKIDIIHSVVRPTPNITQEHYGSIAVGLGQRFTPVVNSIAQCRRESVVREAPKTRQHFLAMSDSLASLVKNRFARL